MKNNASILLMFVALLMVVGIACSSSDGEGLTAMGAALRGRRHPPARAETPRPATRCTSTS